MAHSHNIPVVMYHHVTEQGGFLAMSARQFESQIRGLAEKGYRALKADEFASFFKGRPLPRKSILLTFDDGYLDNWVHAHPILERYGMSAILFAITGLIGNGPARPHAGQGKAVPICLPHRRAKMQMFGNQPDSVMLRWDEVHKMVGAGTFEIHSHTHTHKRWDLECESASEKMERLREDLSASRLVLTQQLGDVSSHLCWPQGYFDADYKQAAQELGFRHLYTTDARGQNLPQGDTTHIHRLSGKNWPFSYLRRRLWLATHPAFGPAYNKWKARSDAQQYRTR